MAVSANNGKNRMGNSGDCRLAADRLRLKRSGHLPAANVAVKDQNHAVVEGKVAVFAAQIRRQLANPRQVADGNQPFFAAFQQEIEDGVGGFCPD